MVSPAELCHDRARACGRRRVPPAHGGSLHAPGAAGYWESALREPTEPVYVEFARVVGEREPLTIDVLYGDQDGGQRTISRCIVLPASDDGWYCQIARHWQVDRDDPR